ncbi:MAG TPA: hypothetical protein PKE39_16815, partial [Ignavibacteria bacterium]|nr:hypothetical protein [Ignavibacteria bacterium]HMR00688.1 hypothetical protein [Ignavibacteria bacterium]
LLSDQKKVTKEKSPAAENYLKLFSLYRKINFLCYSILSPSARHAKGVTQTNFPVLILLK